MKLYITIKFECLPFMNLNLDVKVVVETTSSIDTVGV